MPEQRINSLVSKFDEQMPIPDFTYFDVERKTEYLASYFSEHGYSLFRKEIEMLITLIEELDNGWEVVLVERPIPETGIIYQDSFQMLIKKRYHHAD